MFTHLKKKKQNKSLLYVIFVKQPFQKSITGKYTCAPILGIIHLPAKNVDQHSQVWYILWDIYKTMERSNLAVMNVELRSTQVHI